MKAVNYCECKQRMTIEIIGPKKVYDLNFGWVCPSCKKINSVKKELFE